MNNYRPDSATHAPDSKFLDNEAGILNINVTSFSERTPVSAMERNRVLGRAAIFLGATGIIFGNLAWQNHNTEQTLAQEVVSITDFKPMVHYTLPEILQKKIDVKMASELPDKTIQIIESKVPYIVENLNLYKALAEHANVDWKIIPTLLWRESMLAPGTSIFAGEKLGTINPDHKKIMPANEYDNYLAGLEYFKKGAASIYGVKVTPESSIEDLTKAFLAWNRGNMYRNAKQDPRTSPYLFNGLTDEPMVWTGVGEPMALRGKIDRNPAGAIIFYKHLSELEKNGLLTKDTLKTTS